MTFFQDCCWKEPAPTKTTTTTTTTTTTSTTIRCWHERVKAACSSLTGIKHVQVQHYCLGGILGPSIPTFLQSSLGPGAEGQCHGTDVMDPFGGTPRPPGRYQFNCHCFWSVCNSQCKPVYSEPLVRHFPKQSRNTPAVILIYVQWRPSLAYVSSVSTGKSLNFFSKHTTVGRLFRNIHPSLQYSSHSRIHTSLYDSFFPSHVHPALCLFPLVTVCTISFLSFSQ